MPGFDWVYVNSYEQAVNALENGVKNISTYEVPLDTLMEYEGEGSALKSFADALARNGSCARLR